MTLANLSRAPQRSIRESIWLRRTVFALVGVIFLWPSYGELKLSGLPNLSIPRLLTTALVVLLIIQFINSKLAANRFWHRIRTHWVLFSLLAVYHIFRILSFSFDGNSERWLYEYLKNEIFTNIIIMIGVIYVARNDQDVTLIIKTLVTVSLAVTAITILESVIGKNLFQAWFSETHSGVSMAFSDKSRDMRYRAQGTFGHPLILAQYAACLLPLAWWILHQPTRTFRWIGRFSIFGLITCAWLSATRSGLAFVVFVCIIVAAHSCFNWWIRFKNRGSKMLAFVLAVLISAMVALFALSWFLKLTIGRTDEEAGSSLVRLEMLTKAIPKIFNSMLFGYGPTNALVGVGFSGQFGNFIDNYFLLVALQSGIIAALLLLTIFLLLAKYGIPGVIKHTSPHSNLISMIGISIFSFLGFQIVHASAELLPLFYILIGCFVVLHSHRINYGNHIYSVQSTIFQYQTWRHS